MFYIWELNTFYSCVKKPEPFWAEHKHSSVCEVVLRPSQGRVSIRREGFGRDAGQRWRAFHRKSLPVQQAEPPSRKPGLCPYSPPGYCNNLLTERPVPSLCGPHHLPSAASSTFSQRASLRNVTLLGSHQLPLLKNGSPLPRRGNTLLNLAFKALTARGKLCECNAPKTAL